MTKRRHNANSAAREASGSKDQSASRSEADETNASTSSFAASDSPSTLAGSASKQHVTPISQPTDTESAPAQPHPVQRASAFSVAQEQLNRVAKAMGLDDDLRAHLSMPRRELIVHFPVEMDDGSLRNFTGFRVHHNTALGPTKGGIRYHPDVSLDESAGTGHVDDVEVRVNESALWGRQGRCGREPKGGCRRGNCKAMTRRYTTEISLFIGPEMDIPAPDVGTDARVMAWVMDTFSMNRGYSVPAVTTGKPLAVGGSAGREYATGLGITYITRAMLRRRMGVHLEDATGCDPGVRQCWKLGCKGNARTGRQGRSRQRRERRSV